VHAELREDESWSFTFGWEQLKVLDDESTPPCCSYRNVWFSSWFYPDVGRFTVRPRFSSRRKARLSTAMRLAV